MNKTNVCMCVLHAHVCVQVAHLCVYTKHQQPIASFISFYLTFLKQSLSLNLGITVLAGLDWLSSKGQESYLCLPRTGIPKISQSFR